MAYYVDATASRPPLRHHETGTAAQRRCAMPAQLFCRRLIEAAFHECLETEHDGRPTAAALESWEWLSARLNWTLRGEGVPPEELRSEFYGSFEWACLWLSEDPDTVRQNGLAPAHAFIKSARNHRDWVAGLPDVQRRWTIAASRHECLNVTLRSRPASPVLVSEQGN
jgi:hypothetical protein